MIEDDKVKEEVEIEEYGPVLLKENDEEHVSDFEDTDEDDEYDSDYENGIEVDDGEVSYEGEEEEDYDNKKGKKKTQGKSKQKTSETFDWKARDNVDDPWGLKGATMKSDWRNMRCPPLEIFHFQRLIVDEYTYLGAEKPHSDSRVVQDGIKVWPVRELYSKRLVAIIKLALYNGSRHLAGSCQELQDVTILKMCEKQLHSLEYI